MIDADVRTQSGRPSRSNERLDTIALHATLVAVVQPAEVRDTDDGLADRVEEMHGPRNGSILGEGQMRARAIVMDPMGTKQAARVRLAQDDDVVEQVATNGANDVLAERILPGRARSRWPSSTPKDFTAARKPPS
jgi:hypothetical protein